MASRANAVKAKPAKKARKPAVKKANGKAKPIAKASKPEESERQNLFPSSPAFRRRWNAQVEQNQTALWSNKEVMKNNKGKYVLMRDGEILAFYDDRLEAREAGFARFKDCIFSALHIQKYPYRVPTVFAEL